MPNEEFPKPIRAYSIKQFTGLYTTEQIQDAFAKGILLDQSGNGHHLTEGIEWERVEEGFRFLSDGRPPVPWGTKFKEP